MMDSNTVQALLTAWVVSGFSGIDTGPDTGALFACGLYQAQCYNRQRCEQMRLPGRIFDARRGAATLT